MAAGLMRALIVVCELAGIGLLIAAAALWHPVLGIAVTGGVLLIISRALPRPPPQGGDDQEG